MQVAKWGNSLAIRLPAAIVIGAPPHAANDEHDLAKTKVYGSSPKDQYDGNFRLFLGNDLADQGEGHLADT